MVQPLLDLLISRLVSIRVSISEVEVRALTVGGRWAVVAQSSGISMILTLGIQGEAAQFRGPPVEREGPRVESRVCGQRGCFVEVFALSLSNIYL